MKAVLFDMDGTFVDSESLHKEAEDAQCRQYGVELSDEDKGYFVGRSKKDIFVYVVDKYKIAGKSVDELVSENMDFYERIAQDSLKLYDGFQELAGFLKPRHKLAVVTSSNKRAQEFVFRKFNLDQIFDAVVNADMVQKRKPEPEPYQLCLTMLGIGPLDAVVLEDSPNGILSAKLAGILTVAVGHSFPRQELASSAFYVRNLAEAKAWFERYTNVESFES